MSVPDSVNHVVDRLWKVPPGLEFGVEDVQLGAGRQLAPEQQVGGLLEVRIRRQVVDRVTAIAQLAGTAIDEGRGRAVQVDTLQAPMNLDRLLAVRHGGSLPFTPGVPGVSQNRLMVSIQARERKASPREGVF